MCLFSGEGTEPATPILPGDAGKEDARETFKGNNGMDRTLQGKIGDGTLNHKLPMVTFSTLFP